MNKNERKHLLLDAKRLKYPGKKIDGVPVRENQFNFALYYEAGDGDTCGNAKASFLRAYPNASESTASHATLKLKEPGVIAARKYIRRLMNTEAMLTAQHDNNVAVPKEIMVFWTQVMRNEPDETGRRPHRTADRIKAAHELAEILGMYEKNEATDKGIQSISIVVNDRKDKSFNKVIDTSFKPPKELEDK